jgi:hypothetical protein
VKKKNMISIAAGIAVVLLSFVLGFLQKNPPVYVGILFNCGIVLVVVGLLRHLRYGKGIEFDERTLFLAFKSQTIAFQLSVLALTCLWIVNYFYPIGISLTNFLALLVCTMCFLSVAINIFINQKAKR